MKRFLSSGLAAALALCLVGSTALAGPVQVFSDWARGDMGTAHNATNGQYIGCWVDTDPTGPPLLYCEAFDGATSVGFCFTTNYNLLATAAGIADSTDIEFGWDDGNVCSFFMVNNFSQFPGRKP